MKATYQKYILNFKQASGTSRGILKTKETYFLKLVNQDKIGIGECAVFKGLSIDDRPDYEEKLNWLCENINANINDLLTELIEFPSIQFGLEQAVLSLKSKTPFELFPSKFTQSKEAININGLIWMGSEAFMKKQIEEKLKAGFSTIKMKIGAINFETELGLLKSIRNHFSSKEIELRVDANGAFNPNEALEKLKCLSDFEIHSIEQPIKQGQINEMADLCLKTPLPIALDEELIAVFNVTKKQELLQIINPQYIILKPSLVGGFKGSEDWINLAEKQQIGWWITSALESNIGLNAIAQWTYNLGNKMPQGLGTGSLFTNNFESPLEVKNGHLHYNSTKKWKVDL
ncbi:MULTISPECIES: o-succinylbenzoate synthase [Flavobacteriaceae]|uniref:O-succinylbenzoate synthase n=2 Tax=Flavobacteriaceae TaxID=49546 RepID=A0A4Y8ANR0_9FLAO|nr:MULTISPECIES: o-succinylbenzoate synthase [Flavobacteriaceae]TEW72101.1 o-succinylbenzoate synthase [Gramella jeungdoensis]GGK56388.1 o-succinylbenzoate synthase [Lutibacter litoralis]